MQKSKGLLLAASFLLACSFGSGCASNHDKPNIQQVPGERQIPLPSRIQEYTNFREAESVGNDLAGKFGIRSAYVFVVDSTAFVAVNPPGPTSGQLKQEVTMEAQRVDPSIRNVFVSSDPTLYQKFQGYSQFVRAGHPTQVVYEDFAEEIHRAFPQV